MILQTARGSTRASSSSLVDAHEGLLVAPRRCSLGRTVLRNPSRTSRIHADTSCCIVLITAVVETPGILSSPKRLGRVSVVFTEEVRVVCRLCRTLARRHQSYSTEPGAGAAPARPGAGAGSGAGAGRGGRGRGRRVQSTPRAGAGPTPSTHSLPRRDTARPPPKRASERGRPWPRLAAAGPLGCPTPKGHQNSCQVLNAPRPPGSPRRLVPPAAATLPSTKTTLRKRYFMI